MGNTSCYYSSSGNGASSCSSDSWSGVQLSTGAIIGIVFGCIVAVILIVIVIILIMRAVLHRPLNPLPPLYQQPYQVNNQPQWPSSYQAPTSEPPPPYSQAIINNK